jgi:hypothetical protein
MSTLSRIQRPESISFEESPSMSKRIALYVAAVAVVSACFLSIPLSASAQSPWWQITTGSHPTNLWEPTDNVQEIDVSLGEFEAFPGEEAAAAKILVGGKEVGCLGTTNFVGSVLCAGFYGFPASETAAELEATLEAALGFDVQVTGGPVGIEPFKVTVFGRSIPIIDFFQEEMFSSVGDFSTKVLSPGGSGRLVVTLTNLGDAPVDATSSPVTIVDELPEDVEAVDAQAFWGAQRETDGLECEVESNQLTCDFEGILTSYESIELEVNVNLTGEPPVVGAPGNVTVSGGNAKTISVPHVIKVSPEKTPFGIEDFQSRVEEEGGGLATRAGKHPFQITTNLQLNTGRYEPAAGSSAASIERAGQPRNLRFPLPAGLVGNIKTLPTCSLADFYGKLESSETVNRCPDAAVIGAISTRFALNPLGVLRPAVPVFNLPPRDGEPARFGFIIARVPTVVDTQVDPDNKYRVIASVNNLSQVPKVVSSTLTIWGTPGDPRHDAARGWGCVYNLEDTGPCERPANLGEDAFLRMPVSCVTPLRFEAEAEPWNVPTLDKAVSEGPTMNGCNQVPFDPKVAASPTSGSAESPSGLDFQLKMPNAGLLNKDAIAEGQAKKVEVTLPDGMTLNPSQAEGLAACSPAQYAAESSSSLPGQGCPEASKVGSVHVTTPLLNEEAKGSVYVAKPYDNPFGSLLALYMVARIPERGILIKQAGRIDLDPNTGQIVTTFEDLPQIPFDTFDLNFFAGNEAPLVMPSQCGTYDIVTKFTPWSAADPDNPQPNEIVERTTSFTVGQGAGGGACPSGTPPFNPGFEAGTTSYAAGSYSPFNIRLTRQDGEGEFSRFSVKLPKGVIGKLAGIPFCPDSAIAAAQARSGSNAGQEELDSPSCPAASQIGRTLVGAGVGPDLSWAPGRVYLAGPYQGSKLSIVAIATAKVGPFDLGTVVIRQALRIDPETAEVTSDGESSNPIPHILKGVVVHARAIRVYIDRDNFVLNPTNCERMSAVATVLSGAGQAADVSAPFQAADCLNLGFKPKLSLQLLGGTTRTATPRLRAVLKARKGDANIGRAQVTLPKSEFLEQNHIRTVCTRVQFNAGGGNGEQCPRGSIYGKAKAISPLLDEPLQGPVFLRSSNHELPDMVAALHSSKVDIDLVGRIDSVNGGGIRSTFESTPDAPVRKFVLEMQGGQKGLIVNSEDLCKAKHRANAAFTGQNGKLRVFHPVVKTKCGGKKKGRGK